MFMTGWFHHSIAAVVNVAASNGNLRPCLGRGETAGEDSLSRIKNGKSEMKHPDGPSQSKELHKLDFHRHKD